MFWLIFGIYYFAGVIVTTGTELIVRKEIKLGDLILFLTLGGLFTFLSIPCAIVELYKEYSELIDKYKDLVVISFKK